MSNERPVDMNIARAQKGEEEEGPEEGERDGGGGGHVGE